MIKKILSALSSVSNDNKETTRRRFPRRENDICVLSIDGANHPVLDWSQCGVLFSADGRAFKSGDKVSVTLKFKRPDIVTEITLKSRIVRTGRSKVALEFTSIPKKVQKTFSTIIAESDGRTGSSKSRTN